MNEPEMFFESKTQEPETMVALLGKDYDQTEVTVLSDQPEEKPADAAPPVEQSPAPPVAGEPAGAPEAEAVPPAAPDPEAKSKSGSAKLRVRLEKERLERERVQADNARLAAENETLKKAVPAAPAPAAPAAQPEAVNDPEPQEDQFNGDWTAYTKALSKWSAREALREREKADRLAQERAAAEKQATETQTAKVDREAIQAAETERWDELVEDAKEEYPDYDDVMKQTAGQVVGAPALVTAVKDHEDGAKLAYYLCTHLDEEKRIAELVKLPEKPTERQIRQAVIRANFELAKIKLEAPAAPAAPPAKASREARPPEPGKPAVPRKPTPPSPVGARGNPSVRKLEHMSKEEIESMDIDEYRRRRDAGEGVAA